MVKGRYAYRGKEIERCVRRRLKEDAGTMIQMDMAGRQHVDYHDEGYGELSLLLALSHPEVTVVSHISDEERRQIAVVAAQGIAENIVFQS
jgi:hypothetical protein